MDLQVEKQQQGPVEYELKVTVPAEIMAGRVSAALDELSTKVKMPGFRPGRVPRRIMLERYGDAVTTDTVQDVLQEAYVAALDQSEIVPVSAGQMADVQYEHGTPLTFTVKVEVMPAFDLPLLSDVTVELLEPKVEEEDVLSALDALRESHAVLTPTDEAANRLSVITADLQELDTSGLPIVGRAQKEIEFDLGRPSLGEDFAAKVSGLAPGGSTVVELPGRTQQGEKTSTRLQVTVRSVRRKELPPLDDDFARTINPKLAAQDDLKNDLRRYLEARAAHAARERMLHSAVDALLKKVDFPVPPRMLEAYLDHMAQDGMRGRNDKPDETELQRFKDEYRASAIWNLRWYLVRKKIIAERDLSVGEDEYREELQRMARLDNRPLAEFERRLTEEQADHIREDLLERKVLDVLQSEIRTVSRSLSLTEFEGRSPGRIVTA